MKKYKFRSISNIEDHIPSKRNPVYNSYDNKLLSKFSCDDFASLVFDLCDANGKLIWDKKHFLYQIEMLDYIPENYARVYLYGVWQIVKETLLIEIKLAKVA
jgi:hypothetical protein